jgi:hypothetical protein
MPATDRSTPSIYLQAKKLVRAAILALELEGLNDKEVVIRDGPWNHNKIFRGITVWGNKIAKGVQSSNYRNSRGYACVVTMITLDAGSPSGAEAGDRLPLWKSVIDRRFHNQQLPGLEWPGATHHSTTVQEFPIALPKGHPDGDAKSADGLIVWYWVREAVDAGE